MRGLGCDSSTRQNRGGKKAKKKKKKKFHVSHREDEGVGIGQMEADRDPREFCN